MLIRIKDRSFCLHRNQSKRQLKTLLSREEALRLGHTLHFSLQEMQWFLLRVFDVDDGFSYKSSEDLIDAYGFLSGLGSSHVKELKQAYEELSADTEKRAAEETIAPWTQSMEDSIVQKTVHWSQTPDQQDTLFLEWLSAQAAYLDVPSRTSLRVFRNLAAYAYQIIEKPADLLVGEELYRQLRKLSSTQEETESARTLFYDENSMISTKKCKDAANKLFAENASLTFTNRDDARKAWHMIVATTDGTPTSSGQINSQRNRMPDILSGVISPQKCDLLYLIWMIINQSWGAEDPLSSSDIFDRIADFTETAEYCLNQALLPAFYPPHLLEQSMLLSIITTDNSEYSPAETYELMCESLIQTKHKTTGARKHSKEEKLEAVQYCLNHPEEDLKSCAAKFDISHQSLYAWKSKYLKTGSL